MTAFSRTIEACTTFFLRFPPEGLSNAPSRLLPWLDRQRQRARLAQLEDWRIEDIGISHSEAMMESGRWN